MGPTEFIAAVGKGKLGPAYFLRGPDLFLHEECRSALAASVPEESRAWCLTQVEFEPGHLARWLEGAHQMPMLGSRSFFLFSDPEDFKRAGDDDFEALQAYLEKPSPFATLVFAASEPDRRRRFIQLLEKKAAVVEMRPLARREAAAWLRHYLRRAGVETDPELAEEIVTRFESRPDSRGEPGAAGVNLLWMRTEIEKLLTAKSGARRLERADLELIASVREDHEIGRLLQAIADRQFGRALEHLRDLAAGREPETLLLWAIGDLFRQTLKSSSSKALAGGWSAAYRDRASHAAGHTAGHHAGHTAATSGWFRQANPFSTFEIARRAAQTYSRQELFLALRLVRAADLAIKSAWKDSRLLLEVLVWQIITGRGEDSAPAFELPGPSAEG